MAAVWIAELAAASTRSGRYKTLAHRAFWSGRDRLDSLEKNWYEQQRIWLALASLAADESIEESPLDASVEVHTRRARERTDWSVLSAQPPVDRYPLFRLHPDERPSKVVIRTGHSTAHESVVLQAEQLAGHSHPDSASVIHYSGDHSIYLCGARSLTVASIRPALLPRCYHAAFHRVGTRLTLSVSVNSDSTSTKSPRSSESNSLRCARAVRSQPAPSRRVAHQLHRRTARCRRDRNEPRREVVRPEPASEQPRGRLQPNIGP
jgi:hypothetical protein